MANPNFVPTFSSDEIWRGQDTNRCISDDLDTIERDILDLKNKDDGTGKYAPIDHNHDSEYSNINHNHDSAYAKMSHNHDEEYAKLDHKHDVPTLGDIGITMSETPAPSSGKPNTVYLQTVRPDASFDNDSVFDINQFQKGWAAYNDYQRPTIYRFGKLRIMYGAIKNTEQKSLGSVNHELAFNIPAQDAPVRAVVTSNQHSGNTHFMMEIAGTNVSVGRCQDQTSPVGKWWNVYAVWSVA